jgi:hypothetical protein
MRADIAILLKLGCHEHHASQCPEGQATGQSFHGIAPARSLRKVRDAE